jgi:hypothetical protein
MVNRKRQTIAEARWPNTDDFVELAKNWRKDAISYLLNLVWEGYNVYHKEVLSQVDLSQTDDQIERTITQDLAIDIHDAMSGFEPFVVQPERFEMEGRQPSPARPKQYDIAFVWRDDRRATLPLEAKILRSDGSVAEYVKEITENYLKCLYAPFSSEAGMLGYLLRGNPQQAFNNIEKSIPCRLSNHPDFANREHKISDHQREVPIDKKYPSNFRCHHMILEVASKQATQNISTEENSNRKWEKKPKKEK